MEDQGRLASGRLNLSGACSRWLAKDKEELFSLCLERSRAPRGEPMWGCGGGSSFPGPHG